MVQFTLENRACQDYVSYSVPRLLLIANKPLPEDDGQIFNSEKGKQYLDACFKSKYKAIETHVTYIDDLVDEHEENFARKTLFTILDFYFKNNYTDFSKLQIAFIGEETLDSFIISYHKFFNQFGKDLYVDRDDAVLKIFSNVIYKNAVRIPYVILPDINSEYKDEDILFTLNRTNTAKYVITSPYSKTDELMDKFNNLLDLYNQDIINNFRFNTRFKPNARVGDYFTIYDNYSHKELIYCRQDLICSGDSREKQLEMVKLMEKALTTIPVYTTTPDDFNIFLSQLKYKEKIRVLTAEIAETIDVKNTRAVFRIEGDKNGTESEWYKKWYNNVFLPKVKADPTNPDVKNPIYKDTKKYEWIYDIEVFKYDWLFIAKTLDGKNKIVCWNDADSLWKWIGNKILIGFNNAAYDDVVIRHAMAYPYLVNTAPTVKEFSDSLILDDEGQKNYSLADQYKSKGYPPRFLSWDLSFHMPFDIRRNSLKKLTMAILNRKNYDSNVPFDIQLPLTQKQRDDVEKYCEMDVDNTRDLFLPDPEDIKQKELNPKHKMREFAKESYDIRWNLIVEYKMGAKTLINKSSSFAGKLLCGEDAKPNPSYTYKEIDGKKVYYNIPELAMKELAGTELLDFYLKNQSNPEYINEKFEYYLGGTDEGHLYQFGFGGLHQALLNFGGKNLVNMDVASLYPSLLVEYNLMSRGASNPESYKEVYHTRLTAKKEGKKLLNLGLKLILNGSIGAMLSRHNPLFDTWSNSTICVHGQLLLFVLVKRLYEAGFNIVQTNTDGIMIEKQPDVDYMPIAEQWMKETRLVLEFDDIDLVQQNNVNNYFCRFSNGEVKSKGFYLSNEKFGKATSKILCNLVTDRPPLEGTTPKDYVIFKKHSIGEIYDGITRTKLEGRSLAFVVGYASDPRTQSYYSRSRNQREVICKNEKGKTILDENGKPVTMKINSESKITGFTDHMLLVDDVNNLTMEEINTQEYINFARNLLDREEEFGPYYNENFAKVEEPAFLQALNRLKDNTDANPTKAGVVCQNFLFEADYMDLDEQRELIERMKDKIYRVVFSGNKSYHIVVRLDRPVTSTVYKRIWYHLRSRLGFIGADEACSVPNKYTRVPDQINPKTGNMQTLYCYDKNVIKLDDILVDLPKLCDETQEIKKYKGQVTLKALERHIKRQDWSDGNRFSACQKLSPVLISLVDYNTLLGMIPCKLDKDHKRVIKSKLYYFNKYKDQLLDKPVEEEKTDESE